VPIASRIRQLLGLSRPFSAGDIPTVDLYFLYAVGDLVTPSGPIRRLGPYTFAAGGAAVVIRYVTDDELAAIRRLAPRKIFYVLDDIIPMAAAASDLPADYARRLAHFAKTLLPELRALAPVVLSPSPATLDLFPELERHPITPVLPYPIGAKPAPGHPEPPSICFLGTRSHQEILPLVATLADGLAARHPGHRITLYWGNHLPRRLVGHPAIDNRPPLAWPAFREMLRRTTFDIALAPVWESAFNSGRSFNKILDHALVGAAGLYSRRLPFLGVVEDGVNGLLVDDAPEAWLAALTSLVESGTSRQSLANGGIALANAVGDPRCQRADWLERLGLP
jgi:hypothetical protein